MPDRAPSAGPKLDLAPSAASTPDFVPSAWPMSDGVPSATSMQKSDRPHLVSQISSELPSSLYASGSQSSATHLFSGPPSTKKMADVPHLVSQLSSKLPSFSSTSHGTSPSTPMPDATPSSEKELDIALSSKYKPDTVPNYFTAQNSDALPTSSTLVVVGGEQTFTDTDDDMSVDEEDSSADDSDNEDAKANAEAYAKANKERKTISVRKNKEFKLEPQMPDKIVSDNPRWRKHFNYFDKPTDQVYHFLASFNRDSGVNYHKIGKDGRLTIAEGSEKPKTSRQANAFLGDLASNLPEILKLLNKNIPFLSTHEENTGEPLPDLSIKGARNCSKILQDGSICIYLRLLAQVLCQDEHIEKLYPKQFLAKSGRVHHLQSAVHMANLHPLVVGLD